MIRRLKYLGMLLLSDLVWDVSDLLSWLQVHRAACTWAEWGLSLHWVGYWRYKCGHKGKANLLADVRYAFQCGHVEISGEASGCRKNSSPPKK